MVTRMGDMLWDIKLQVRGEEVPGLLLLIRAHQELESLTLAADVLRSKRQLEQQWADQVYQGLWYGPLKDALDGFIDRTQRTVNGTVRVKRPVRIVGERA